MPRATKDALFSMFGVPHRSFPVWHECATSNAFEDNQKMLSKGLLWCAYYRKKKGKMMQSSAVNTEKGREKKKVGLMDCKKNIYVA